ncbi:hypothetical protein GCM10017750_06280 [Streptomyces racemochromogenes]
MFRTYETVARETPARRATSALVGTGAAAGGAGGVRRPGGFGESDMARASFQTDRVRGLAVGRKRVLDSAYTFQ